MGFLFSQPYTECESEHYSESKSKTLEDGRVQELDIEEVKKKWEKEQKELKCRLVLHDVENWSTSPYDLRNLEYIAGVDISFVKGDDKNACAALVVLSFPSLDVVFEDLRMITLTAPYLPGFLAFREVPFLEDMVNHLRITKPQLMPQVILVDGNGILHPRGFGLACHLGVLVNIPTVGVSKNLFHVDGLERNEEFKIKVDNLQKAGDRFVLKGKSGKVLGMALRTSDSASKPVFISQGHKVSIDTAVRVVLACSHYRIPEPTRQADIRSREYIRDTFPET